MATVIFAADEERKLVDAEDILFRVVNLVELIEAAATANQPVAVAAGLVVDMLDDVRDIINAQRGRPRRSVDHAKDHPSAFDA